MDEGAVTSPGTFPVQTQHDVIVLLKRRCLLVWERIVLNQRQAAFWNWIMGTFEFYFSALLDTYTVKKSWGDHWIALCNSKITYTKASQNPRLLEMTLIQMDYNIPVFVGCNIHLSNEAVPTQVVLTVFNSLSSLQAAKKNQLPVR